MHFRCYAYVQPVSFSFKCHPSCTVAHMVAVQSASPLQLLSLGLPHFSVILLLFPLSILTEAARLFKAIITTTTNTMFIITHTTGSTNPKSDCYLHRHRQQRRCHSPSLLLAAASRLCHRHHTRAVMRAMILTTPSSTYYIWPSKHYHQHKHGRHSHLSAASQLCHRHHTITTINKAVTTLSPP